MKKYLLIFLVFFLIGVVFWTVHELKMDTAKTPEAPQVTASPNEEDESGKQITDLTLNYFSDDQRYRLETVLQAADEVGDGEVSFQGLKASLWTEDRPSQQFTAPSGILQGSEGVVQLQGPVAFSTGTYQLLMNQVEMNLNQGIMQAKGTISVAAGNYSLTAEGMTADLDLQTIHFTGRPRLTVTKGG